MVSCFCEENKLLNDLKKKYRTISLKYHPDKQNYSKDISTILFAEISNIYEMFLDSVKLQKGDASDNKYNSLEKKYYKLINEYNNLVEDYNFKNSEMNDLQNNINQQNKEYINLQNEYNKLIYKYNKLVKKYNYERR
jgi:DnaJ-class molecular chaperone